MKITHRNKISPNTQINSKINANDDWNTALIIRRAVKSTDIVKTVEILN